jgi:hypothetical protein
MSANDGARWRAGLTESAFARSFRGAGWVVIASGDGRSLRGGGRVVASADDRSLRGGGLVVTVEGSRAGGLDDDPRDRRRWETPESGCARGTSATVFFCLIMTSMLSRRSDERKPHGLRSSVRIEVVNRDQEAVESVQDERPGERSPLGLRLDRPASTEQRPRCGPPVPSLRVRGVIHFSSACDNPPCR